MVMRKTYVNTNYGALQPMENKDESMRWYCESCGRDTEHEYIEGKQHRPDLWDGEYVCLECRRREGV